MRTTIIGSPTYRAAIAAALQHQFRGTFREDPQPITFKDQAELDKLISDRLAREKSQWERAGGMSDEEKKEFDRLKKLETEATRKKEEEAGNYASALKAQEESFNKEKDGWGKEKTTIVGKLRSVAIDNAVITEAARLGAFNPKEIARLLSDRVTLGDDYEPIVLQEDGKTPAFVKGKPMTPAELVAEYAGKNKHHFKPAKGDSADAKGGAHEKDGELGDDAPELAETKEKLKKIEDKPVKSNADLAEIMRLRRRLKDLEKTQKAE